MAHRAFAALFLLLSLSWLMPFGVLAEDTLPLEIEEVTQQAVETVLPESIPVPDVPEGPLPPVIEEPAPEPEEAAATLSTPLEESEEPELIFDCVMQEDGNGSQTERCGLGYYRTLCGYNAGVEECVTFFELQEEPEPPPILADIGRLRSREYITLHLDWNGVPLPAEGPGVPFGMQGTLGWSYEVSLPEHHDLPYTYQGTYTDMFAAATLTLQIYRGPIGEAELVYSQKVAHGSSGEIPFTFEDSDEYRVILSATYPHELSVPGYECGGELCPAFDPRIESLVWFMENAAAYYDDITDEIDASRYFYEYDVRKSRMSTFEPLVSGMREIVTVDAPQGASNVLFLPGIKGSRLYRPTDSCDPILTLSCPGVKLWEPSGNVLVRDLFLNASGQSGRNDVYVKEGDIVSEVLGNNFYASFVNQMDALKSDGTLIDWKPVAYDWRLSLDDIVNKGVKRGEKIYFQEATDAPYIEQALRELAATSPTGKVSIVAHSNGGLVTKRLMQRLEANGESGLVDQIIFVGVPQSGAPQAMAGLLYGYKEALPFDTCSENFLSGWLCALLGSRDAARELAEHSPMAHHLLPSQAYFDQVLDADHPVAKFTALTSYPEERSRYGSTVDSAQELYDFLEAKDGGRTKPDARDVASANVLDADFLNYARSIHESLDAWEPPSGIRVHQIAGWGMNTIAGVEFYEQEKFFGGYKEMYRPIFVEDGDEVVPVPSALLMSSEAVENYWVDLREASRGSAPDRDHGNLFELDSLRTLVRDILTSVTTDLPVFVSKVRPDSQSSEKLIFTLHSPLTLELYDEEGNHTGEAGGGNLEQNIPGTEYGEFGDVKYILAPSGEYNVVLRGKDSGTFSFDVQKVSGDEVMSSVTVADVPTTKNTIATVKITDDLSEAGMLKIDDNGDGIIDVEVLLEENKVILFEAVSAPNAIEENSRSSSGPSQTKGKRALATNSLEGAVGPVDFAFESPLPEYQKKEVATALEGMVGASEPIKLIEEDASAKRTQTASVYDAVGPAVVRWISSVLYNFWDSLVRIFTDLLSKQ